MSDINKFRFIFTVTMNIRIIGVQNFLLFQLRIRNRNGGYQRMSILVQREIKQFLCRCNFNDISLVYNCNSIRNISDNRQIVCYKQIG